jgi:hypothetical protein
VGLRPAPTRALLVPDDETWLFRGLDVRPRYEPTLEPGRASVLLAAERIPATLEAPLRKAWAEMPVRRRLEPLGAWDPSGLDVHALLHDHGHRGHDGHEHGGVHEHGHGEGHDHHDMMAITGEPSSDGLVMEALDVHAGPLDVALPTGLVVSASLDGDVVAGCEVRATLRSTDSIPDPAAPVAWTLAGERSSGVQIAAAQAWLRVAQLELERATSHLSWLHRFLRLLGWTGVRDETRAQVAAVLAMRAALPEERDLVPQEVRDGLAASASGIATLAVSLERSAAFGRRTYGLARLTRDDVQLRGLAGPVARASGVDVDLRSADPLYAEIGFESQTRAQGDARARALVRADEASQSILLVGRALRRLHASPDVEVPTPSARARVEGPRGPVVVESGSAGPAPGAAAALRAAADVAVGLEWAAALVAVASFDLSPWSVEP